ncbi:unnamed protein product [Strongylus vulgaris]|uniref:Uncharacterized protein n=1 Tax=Strongylus vulgaris TaxID=40348 RepID=A0A3P7JG31_STRVU|nr:unnamed protein product [Strongylus vulgaris]
MLQSTSAEDVFNPAEFGASLCEMEKLEPETDPEPSPTSVEAETTRPNPWSANLDLVYPPRFSDEDVVFGIDGGVLYNGAPAENVDVPALLNVSVLRDKV